MDRLKDLDIVVPYAYINTGILEAVRLAYEKDPKMGGELAIAAIELSACGAYSTNDSTIKMILTPFEKTAKGNVDKYQEKSLAREEQEDDLRTLARLKMEGRSQAAIAKEMGISQSTVSRRLRRIETQFPELLAVPIAATHQTVAPPSTRKLNTDF